MQIRLLQLAWVGLAGALWPYSGILQAGLIETPGLHAPSTPAAGAAVPEQPPQFAKALTAFREGDRPTTLRWLEQARHEHPELAPAEIMLANMFFSDDQPDKGRQALEQAAVKYPTDPEPHLIFGDLARRERRWSDAQVQYERGEQLTTSFNGSPARNRQLKVRALAGLAYVAEARGQFDTAEKRFSAVLKLEPNHPQAHFRLGNVLFALGRPDKALAELRAAADLHDSAPSPTLTLADLYRQAGKTGEAERWIRQAIEESPNDVAPLLRMAKWQLEVHSDPQAAAPFVERAAQLDRHAPDVQLVRGLIAWCQGDRAGAEQTFEAIVLQQPRNATANCYLAAVLAEQGDAERRQRAWELAQLVTEMSPRTIETASTLGWVAYQLGKFEQAERQLLLAAATAGAGRDTDYYLARTLFRRGKIDKAQRALQRAVAGQGLFIHLREARDWQRQLGQPGQ